MHVVHERIALTASALRFLRHLFCDLVQFLCS